MYVGRSYSYYDSGGNQHASRGDFLILATAPWKPGSGLPSIKPLYATVRRVALSQCGHFMMGRVNIGGSWHTVSGPVGNDGLPMDFPQEVLGKYFTIVPDDIAAAYWGSHGHNDVGEAHDTLLAYGRQLAASKKARS